jgi:serine/threonine protein kinase
MLLALQVIQRKKYDTKADVFSLGVVICELLIGHYPYADAERHATITSFANAIVAGMVNMPFVLILTLECSEVCMCNVCQCVYYV